MLFLHLGFRAPPHATVPSAILGGSGSGRCSGSVPVGLKKSCGCSVECVSLWSVVITSVRDHGPRIRNVLASKSTPVNASATSVEPQSPQICSAIPMGHTRSTAAPGCLRYKPSWVMTSRYLHARPDTSSGLHLEEGIFLQ